MRSRARSGTRWTNPSRSWFESRKPIPRPIPVSKYDAERDRLNVTMHWYWFQMLTIRSSFSSVLDTWYVDSRSVQYVLERLQCRVGLLRRREPAQQGVGAFLVHDLVGVVGPLRVLGVLDVAQHDDQVARLARFEVDA